MKTPAKRISVKISPFVIMLVRGTSRPTYRVDIERKDFKRRATFATLKEAEAWRDEMVALMPEKNYRSHVMPALP